MGGTRDSTFGPIVVFGLGGIYTEVIRDYVLEVAPVDPEEVKASLSESRIGRILEGYRGGPKVDADRLAEVISRFSRIMMENPQIDQIEVNPLMASGESIISVDARVILGLP